MTTHWLYSDYLRPLPERIGRQHPPLPCRPDFHVGIPFGGILFRDSRFRTVAPALIQPFSRSPDLPCPPPSPLL